MLLARPLFCAQLIKKEIEVNGILYFFSTSYIIVNKNCKTKKWVCKISIIFFEALIWINYFCMLITFNNPLKACFSNKKFMYHHANWHAGVLSMIQKLPNVSLMIVYWIPGPCYTRHKSKSIFLNEKQVFKDYWCTKLITRHFFSDLAFIRYQRLDFLPPHTQISDL